MWKWLGSLRAREEFPLLFSIGTPVQTATESPDRLRHELENAISREVETHTPYDLTPPPRSARLIDIANRNWNVFHSEHVAMYNATGGIVDVVWDSEVIQNTLLLQTFLQRLPFHDYFLHRPDQSGLNPSPRSPSSNALNYFFVQTPPDQSGSTPAPISFADAHRRIREVHYDRGTIVNVMDMEAKEMADCRMRHGSFNKSEFLRGKVGAYQLSQLGFFFVGDRNAIGKLRCSFCRRTIHMFTTEDAPYLEKDFDRRLIALLNRHSHLSATCPFSLGLNGDDKRFTPDDMAQAVEPLIRTQAVQIGRVETGIVPPMDSVPIRIFAASLASQFPNELPLFYGELSNISVHILCFFMLEYSYCTMCLQ